MKAQKTRFNLLGFLFTWALGITAAFAQPMVSRGDALRKREYQTYSNLTLYVDPTGSDTGACTSSGTGACATIGAALGRIPKNVRHTVQVNVAAGTYSETVQVTGFALARAPNDTSSTPSLTITGTTGAPTLTTGTTTGTLTSASMSGAPSTVTDSGQSWTVDNLKGLFLLMTSGARNGTYYPIVSNTATVLRLASIDTLLVSGATYSIVEPKTILSGQVRVQGNSGGGVVTLESIKYTNATVFNVSTANTTALQIRQSQFVTTGQVAPPPTTSGLTFTRNYVNSSSPSCGLSLGTASGNTVNVSFNYTRGTFAGCSFGGTFSALTGTFEGSNTALTLGAGISAGLQGSIQLKCSTPGSGTGFSVPAPTSLYAMLGSMFASTTYVEDCALGVSVAYPGYLYKFSGAPTFSNVTTAVAVANGGRVDFTSTTPTFTGVTNELSIDSTVYPFSFLTGLAAPQVISNSYGSTFIR